MSMSYSKTLMESHGIFKYHYINPSCCLEQPGPTENGAHGWRMKGLRGRMTALTFALLEANISTEKKKILRSKYLDPEEKDTTVILLPAAVT